jgi:hypothetical protein
MMPGRRGRTSTGTAARSPTALPCPVVDIFTDLFETHARKLEPSRPIDPSDVAFVAPGQHVKLRQHGSCKTNGRRSLWTSDRNGRQGHIDPSLFEETGFGSEPGGALPCCLKPRRHPNGPSRTRRGQLRPSEA